MIAIDGKEYVFIEVKTRMSYQYGTPAEAVDKYKQKHIWNASKYYIYQHALAHKNIRFDVVEVYVKEKEVFIHHIKNVFW